MFYRRKLKRSWWYVCALKVNIYKLSTYSHILKLNIYKRSTYSCALKVNIYKISTCQCVLKVNIYKISTCPCVLKLNIYKRSTCPGVLKGFLTETKTIFLKLKLMWFRMNCVAKHTPETSKGFFYIYLPFYLILARFKKIYSRETAFVEFFKLFCSFFFSFTALIYPWIFFSFAPSSPCLSFSPSPFIFFLPSPARYLSSYRSRPIFPLPLSIHTLHSLPSVYNIHVLWIVF